MTKAIDAAYVVIPAHDEVELLGRQLSAVATAVANMACVWTRVRFSTTVVLDACDDGTEAVLSGFPAVAAPRTDLGCVGAARGWGVAHARRHGSAPAAQTWVACTDADSEVPPDWLLTQLELAAQGADAVLGMVRPDAEELDAQRHHRWLGRHAPRVGHPHVHGANLGFRLSAYDAVGGFRPLHVGEDVDLATRMRIAGMRVVSTSRHPVLTSARLHGRAPGGFASYLLALAD